MNRYKHYNKALLLALLAAAACTEPQQEEPVGQKQLKVTAIKSDNYEEEYRYDDRQQLTQWICTEPWLTSQGAYSYTDKGEINIRASKIETLKPGTDESWLYEEKLSLGSDGLAIYTEGVYSHYLGTTLKEKRNYRKDFSYNTASQLVSIATTVTPISPAGASHTWQDRIEWKGDIITEYIDGSPDGTRTVSYTYRLTPIGMPTPVVVANLGFYYAPLQLNGVFGERPDRLVNVALEQQGSTETRTVYSYLHRDNTKVEGYSKQQGTSPDRTFAITWQ